MANLQREETHPGSEKMIREEMSGSSEDEGPEEVAFDESREVALKSARAALQRARREKEVLKEKRRKRQQFFQEQKKKRLLPESLLEEFDTVPQKQPTVTDINDEAGEEEEEEEVKKSKIVTKSLQGNCSVMRVKDRSTDASLQRSAIDFVQARFYGPGIQRTTNAERLSLTNKIGFKKGPGFQFVNKNWGVAEKAKAEKANKRFIHKKKLISS